MSFGFGVGDFLATGEFAWRLYRDCIVIARGAPQEFKLLVEELKTLNAMMRSFHEEFNDASSVLARAGEDRHKLIAEILKRINETLDSLTQLFDKHRYIGSTARQGFKRTWDKFKWALDAKDVNGLRSKLSYHNGVLGLLLACAGNSSLQRIESTTKSINDGLHQLTAHLRRAQTIAPIATVSTLDEAARVAFSAECMKGAEIEHRWLAIGIDEWIRAGRWWLLKAQFEMQKPEKGLGTVSAEGYLNLLKASWILTDVIVVHPQFSLIESSVQYEVMQLTQAINQEFQRMVDMDLKLPVLSGLNDIVIWEIYTTSPTPKLSHQEEREWAMSPEIIIHQSFGKYQPHNHTTIVTVCISVVLQTAEKARLVLHDQSWRCLANIHLATLQPALRPIGSVVTLHDCTVKIAGQELILGTAGDAALLHAILNLYSRCRFLLAGLPPNRILPYHHAFTLLIALKINVQNPHILQYLSNLKQYQQNAPEVCAFLNCVITMMKSIIHQGLGTPVKSLEDQANKAGNSKLYFMESILGWVSSAAYYDVAREWLQFQGVSLNVDIGSLDKSIDLAFGTDVEVFTGENYDLIKLLLDSGLDPYADHPHYKRSLLYKAACSGHEAFIRLFLDRGAALDAEVGYTYSIKLLHCAAQQENEQVAKLLLDCGADVNCLDGDARTPLHLAADHGNVGIFKLLVERGANIDCRDKSGCTPLHFALRASNVSFDIVKLLLDRGANVNCPDGEYSRTPLHLAARHGHVNIYKLFIERGANVYCKDKDGCTPLYSALRSGCNVGIVKLLLDHGADVNCLNVENAWTALHQAIRHGNTNIIKLFLGRGADVHCLDNQGNTPLHTAARYGNEEILKLLLGRGAVVNCENYSKTTPLHVVASLRNIQNVKMLLEYGANPQIQDLNGKTPFDRARYSPIKNLLSVHKDPKEGNKAP